MTPETAARVADALRDCADIREGKTFKQMATQLRTAAKSDMSGGGKKPAPGMARGTPDKWSGASAISLIAGAEYCEKMAQDGKTKITADDAAKVQAVIRDSYNQVINSPAFKNNK